MASDVVVCNCNVQWPALHHHVNFIERAVDKSVGSELWREGLGAIGNLVQGRYEVRMGCQLLSFVVIFMVVDNVGRWGGRGNPGRDFA